LEQQRQELPFRQPQQEHPAQPQQQPRFSRGGGFFQHGSLPDSAQAIALSVFGPYSARSGEAGDGFRKSTGRV
jgi:hypothetical protein